jgi:ribose transport system substrate-binding protein
MFHPIRYRFRSARTWGLAAGVVPAVLIAAACSSSAGSSASSPASSASSPSGSASASSTGFAAEQATVKQYEAVPTTIPQTTPLTHPVTKGKTFVDLECENTQCHDIATGVEAAAKAIGWNVKLINYNDTQPATLTAAFQQALQYHPVGVSLTGTSPALWAGVLPEYKKAGIPIIPASVGPIQVQAPVAATVDGLGAYTGPAKAIADWFVAQSNASGHLLLVDIPSFPVLKETATAVSAEIAAQCPNCKVTNFDATIAQVDANGVVAAAVSQLQRDPSIKYAISTDGVFISGLASAAKAAGVSGLQIGSTIGGITNEQDILAGSESATLPWPGVVEGWVIIDAAARVSEGMSVPDGDGNQPFQLLVKGNFTTPEESLLEPADYPAQFEKLWLANS